MQHRTGEAADSGRERRDAQTTPAALWHAQLNEAQRMTLCQLERFGWALKFVRRRPFQDPLPVVVDGDRRSFAVLKPDGSLDQHPDFDLREQPRSPDAARPAGRCCGV